MKKLLGGIALFFVYTYGVKNQNVIPSNTIALENSNNTFIILKSNNNSQVMLDKEFLPEAWYSQVNEHKLVQEHDQAGNPLIILKNISSDVLPLVKKCFIPYEISPLSRP